MNVNTIPVKMTDEPGTASTRESSELIEHRLDWTPGSEGKGYVTNEGLMHTWNTIEGQPHHPEMMFPELNLEHYRDFDQAVDKNRELSYPFTIGPGGAFSWVWDQRKHKGSPPVHPSEIDPRLQSMFEEDEPGVWRFGAAGWTVIESDFDPANTFFNGFWAPGRNDQRVVICHHPTRQLIVGQPGTHHTDLIHHHGLDYEAISDLPRNKRQYYKPVEDNIFNWTKDEGPTNFPSLHYGWIMDGGYGNVGPKPEGVTEALHAHGLLQQPDGSKIYGEQADESWRFSGQGQQIPMHWPWGAGTTVQDLMGRQDVVKAVRPETFEVWVSGRGWQPAHTFTPLDPKPHVPDGMTFDQHGRLTTMQKAAAWDKADADLSSAERAYVYGEPTPHNIHTPPEQWLAQAPSSVWQMSRIPFLHYPSSGNTYMGRPGDYHSTILDMYGVDHERGGLAGWVMSDGSASAYGDKRHRIPKHIFDEAAQHVRYAPEYEGFIKDEGLPSSYDESEWKFGKTAGHDHLVPYVHGDTHNYHGWTPGTYGKGFIAPDGRLVSWNVGGYGETFKQLMGDAGPHHREVAQYMRFPGHAYPDVSDVAAEQDRYDAEANGYEYEPEEPSWHTPFDITPEGEYDIMHWSPDKWRIDAQHPAFAQHGLRPRDNSEWKFGNESENNELADRLQDKDGSLYGSVKPSGREADQRARGMGEADEVQSDSWLLHEGRACLLPPGRNEAINEQTTTDARTIASRDSNDKVAAGDSGESKVGEPLVHGRGWDYLLAGRVSAGEPTGLKHNINYIEGQNHKGMIGPDGSIHVWPVDFNTNVSGKALGLWEWPEHDKGAESNDRTHSNMSNNPSALRSHSWQAGGRTELDSNIRGTEGGARRASGSAASGNTKTSTERETGDVQEDANSASKQSAKALVDNARRRATPETTPETIGESDEDTDSSDQYMEAARGWTLGDSKDQDTGCNNNERDTGWDRGNEAEVDIVDNVDIPLTPNAREIGERHESNDSEYSPAMGEARGWYVEASADHHDIVDTTPWKMPSNSTPHSTPLCPTNTGDAYTSDYPLLSPPLPQHSGAYHRSELASFLSDVSWPLTPRDNEGDENPYSASTGAKIAQYTKGIRLKNGQEYHWPSGLDDEGETHDMFMQRKGIDLSDVVEYLFTNTGEQWTWDDALRMRQGNSTDNRPSFREFPTYSNIREALDIPDTTPRTLYHNWEQGTWGKGLIMPDGTPHTWTVDEGDNPHHGDYLINNGLLPDPYPPAWNYDGMSLLTIMPDGETSGHLEPEHRLPEGLTPTDEQWEWRTRVGSESQGTPGLEGGQVPPQIVHVDTSAHNMETGGKSLKGWGQRLPLVYIPAINTVYYGNPDTTHNSINREIDLMGLDNHHGWVGYNPEASWRADAGTDNYGWYDTPPEPHVDKAIRDHFGIAEAEREDFSDWDFGTPRGHQHLGVDLPYSQKENGWRFSAWGWNVVSGSTEGWEDTLHPMNEFDNPQDYDHLPILVSYPNKTLYIGNVGTHHVDLIDEFGDVGFENKAMVYPEGSGHPDEKWYYSGPIDQTVKAALEHHLNQPLTPEGNHSAWKFGAAQLQVPYHMKHDKSMPYDFDPQPWEPGTQGKGLILDNGSHYIWRAFILGAPHHGDIAGYEYQDSEDGFMPHIKGAYTIDASGAVRPSLIWDRETEIPASQFAALHPDLYSGADPEWKFGSTNYITPPYRGGKVAPWFPGVKGKGLTYKGQHYLWRTENGDPHHPDILMSIEPNYRDNGITKFTDGLYVIGPDGGVVSSDLWKHGSADEFAEGHPQLFPSTEDAWTFSNYTGDWERKEMNKWTFSKTAATQVHWIEDDGRHHHDHGTDDYPLIYDPNLDKLVLGPLNGYHTGIEPGWATHPPVQAITGDMTSLMHGRFAPEKMKVDWFLTGRNPEHRERVHQALSNYFGEPVTGEYDGWTFGKTALGGAGTDRYLAELLEYGFPEGGLYHMAPASERKRILQHGLQPGRPWLNNRWVNEYSEEFPTGPGTVVHPRHQFEKDHWLNRQPVGVYGVQHKEDTENWDWAPGMKPHEFDMWFIPEDQIQNVVKDKAGGGTVVTHPVMSPQLMERGEYNWEGWKGHDPDEWKNTPVKVVGAVGPLDPNGAPNPAFYGRDPWQPGDPIEPWEPGYPGKGFLMNGKPVLWRISDIYGGPHHEDIAYMQKPVDNKTIRGYFHIQPDGSVEAEGRGDVAAFVAGDPRLKIAPNSPDWSFSNVANKLEWLESRPDKAIATPEGKQFFEILKNAFWSEKTDPLFPWLWREYKKGRLNPVDRNTLTFEYNDGLNFMERPFLEHIADWFHSGNQNPTRRGVDIMQLTMGDMRRKIDEWEQWIRERDVEENRDGGTVLHKLPNGWTVRELAPENLDYEGNVMGHCVGGQGYRDAVSGGESRIISLRDEKGEPHATMELQKRHSWGPKNPHENDWEIEQVQGKGNTIPKPEYQAMLKDWILGLDEKDRPSWKEPYDEITSADEIEYRQDPNPEEGGYEPHGDYGIPVPEPNINYDRVMSTIHRISPHRRWGEGHYDHNHGELLYNEALKRGQIPQLQKAVQSFDEDIAQKDVDSSVDANYEYLQYPGEYEEDPERWDSIGEANGLTGQEAWKEADETYEWDYRQLAEEHSSWQAANHLQGLLAPHWNGKEFVNEKQPGVFSRVASIPPPNPAEPSEYWKAITVGGQNYVWKGHSPSHLEYAKLHGLDGNAIEEYWGWSPYMGKWENFNRYKQDYNGVWDEMQNPDWKFLGKIADVDDDDDEDDWEKQLDAAWQASVDNPLSREDILSALSNTPILGEHCKSVKFDDESQVFWAPDKFGFPHHDDVAKAVGKAVDEYLEVTPEGEIYDPLADPDWDFAFH